MRILGLLGLSLAMSWPATAWAGASSLSLTSLRATGLVQPEGEEEGEEEAEAEAEEAGGEEPDPSMQPTSSKAPDSTMQPTSSKAPGSTTPVAEEPVVEEPEPEPTPATTDDGESLSDQRSSAATDMAFHRHGVGVQGGISIVPTWLLSSFLASHTNALCRGSTIGSFAGDRGLSQQDGCNFYVGGHYVYRFSRVLDVSASVQYQRAKLPDGLWLDKARYNGLAGEVGSADYTEVELGLLALEVDFIARAPIVVTKDVEFGLGGGGGLGLGVVFGNIYQTALGFEPTGYSNGAATPGTCETLEDLADLTRCTPRWDASQASEDATQPDPSQFSDPSRAPYANCTTTECNDGDLQAFGYRREQGGIPPVIPVVNLILSARLIIKDAVGITVNGGWNTGFYFGGGLQYYFGKPSQDEMTKGAEIGKRRRRRAGRI